MEGVGRIHQIKFHMMHGCILKQYNNYTTHSISSTTNNKANSKYFSTILQERPCTKIDCKRCIHIKLSQAKENYLKAATTVFAIYFESFTSVLFICNFILFVFLICCS